MSLAILALSIFFFYYLSEEEGVEGVGAMGGCKFGVGADKEGGASV